jgi:hypothetical protein
MYRSITRVVAESRFGSEAAAPAVEKESDHEDNDNQSNRADTPSGAHSPIQSATTTEQQEQKYDDE